MVEVFIDSNEVQLRADAAIPDTAQALVIFTHGSGSDRKSPCNFYVAQQLYKAGFATLVVDLFTEEEKEIDDTTAKLRFNIELLVERLEHATLWARKQPETKSLVFMYFGSTTAASATLIAAAHHPDLIRAIVLSAGRTDIAADHLDLIKAPTLFIVGSKDASILRINQQTIAEMPVETELEVIEEAGHLFTEPETLERVAKATINWYERHSGR